MTNEDFIKSISLEGEEWRIIDDTMGYFSVSNFGRIASLSRLVKGGNCMYYTKQHILTTQKDKHGYIRARLVSNNGVNQSKMVHRLVAKAFVPNPNNYEFIDHIDGTRNNNHYTNLRWCTRSMNMMNPITRKRNSNARKGKTPKNARPIVQLHKDGSFVASFYSVTEASNKLGLSSGTLCDCLRNHKHSYKGYKWWYLEEYDSLINMSKNSNLSQ